MSSTSVLVVDDDVAICRILHRMLSDEQYQVQISQSVADAIGAIGQKLFDVYVMDYKLPDGLLDLLVAELFGLVQSAIELRNQTLAPTLRQRAFFLGFVLPGYFTLVVWRLNPRCALWHLYNIAKSDVFSRQYSVTQHLADVFRLGLSHNLAGELVVSLPSYQRKSSLSLLLLPRFSLLPLGDTIRERI